MTPFDGILFHLALGLPRRCGDDPSAVETWDPLELAAPQVRG